MPEFNAIAGPTGPHITVKQSPPPYLVTFRSERVVRHAAILWIVIGYLWLAGSALGFLLLLNSLSSLA